MNFVVIFLEPEAGEAEKVQVQDTRVETQELVGLYVERADMLGVPDDDQRSPFYGEGSQERFLSRWILERTHDLILLQIVYHEGRIVIVDCEYYFGPG